MEGVEGSVQYYLESLTVGGKGDVGQNGQVDNNENLEESNSSPFGIYEE